MLEFVAFYLFSALILFCFAVVVLSANVLYAMSALAAGMILISGVFFLLDAEFLGVVQISVYTGAVMALYAFGMMFFDSAREVKERVFAPKWGLFFSVGTAALLVLIITLPRELSLASPAPQNSEMGAKMGNVEALGMALFSDYLLAFEIAALMLLVSMIVGIMLVVKRAQNRADSPRDSRQDSSQDSRKDSPQIRLNKDAQ